MPVKKILLILSEDDSVKGRILPNTPRLDPLVKWLLIVTALLVVFLCALLLRPAIPLAIAVTPTPTPTQPPLRVIGPLEGSTLGLVQPVRLQVVGRAEAAITRLALRVNGIETDAIIPTPIGPLEVSASGASRNRAVTTLTHLFEWRPQGPGKAVIEVILYTLDGRIISTSPTTYYVADDRAPVTLVIEQLDATRTPMPVAPDSAPTWPSPHRTEAPDVSAGF